MIKINEIKDKKVTTQEVMSYLQFLHNKMNPFVETEMEVTIQDNTQLDKTIPNNKSKLNMSMQSQEEDVDLAALS
jgi:hypothetical protein